MKPVTDPDILAQLNSSSSGGMRPVTDPKILAQLNGESEQTSPKESSYLRDALESGADLVTGFGNAVNRFPAQLANLLSPKSMQAKVPEEVPGLAGQVGGLAGDVGTMIGLGGPASALLKAGESAPLVGRAAAELGKEGILPGMARFGTGAGAYEATMNPEDRLGAGLSGFGFGAAGAGLGSLVSKLMGHGLGKTNLTPEKLMENVRIAGETPTGLGDIIGSPELKRRLENTYGRNPSSGYDDKTFAVQQHLTDKGNQILSKYLGNTHPLEVNSKIGEGLNNAYKAQEATKRALYAVPEEIASKEGFKLSLPSFSENVNKHLSVIEKQDLLKYEPDSQELLRKLSNYANAKSDVKPSITQLIEGKLPEIESPSLKEANILSGKLGAMAKQYKASPTPDDRNKAAIFSDLSKSLKNDIYSSMKNSGNDKLLNSFTQAEKNYKENFVPFLDKDIYKFTNGGENPEKLIQKFINTSRTTDQSGNIQKFMNKLDPETQNLVKYGYLSRSLHGAEDERVVNPNKLKTLWTNESLGQNQKKALMPDKAERKQLDDYSKLVGMNPEAMNRMFNPKTGYRSGEHSNILYHFLGGAAGAGIGNGEGGAPGAMIGSAAGMFAPSLYSRAMTNKLTSPEFRKKFVENLIRRQSKGEGISPSTLGGALSASTFSPSNQ